jgi:hypothetical protein
MEKSVYQWRTENCKHLTENMLNYFPIHWRILLEVISFYIYIKKKAPSFKKYHTNTWIKYYCHFIFMHLQVMLIN